MPFKAAPVSSVCLLLKCSHKIDTALHATNAALVSKLQNGSIVRWSQTARKWRSTNKQRLINHPFAIAQVISVVNAANVVHLFVFRTRVRCTGCEAAFFSRKSLCTEGLIVPLCKSFAFFPTTLRTTDCSVTVNDRWVFFKLWDHRLTHSSVSLHCEGTFTSGMMECCILRIVPQALNLCSRSSVRDGGSNQRCRWTNDSLSDYQNSKPNALKFVSRCLIKRKEAE